MRVFAIVTVLVLFLAVSMRHLTQLSHEYYDKIGDDVVKQLKKGRTFVVLTADFVPPTKKPHFVGHGGLAVHWRRLGNALEQNVCGFYFGLFSFF